MANIQKRQGKNGKVSYRALVRLKGHKPVSATFSRLTDAKNWVQNTESAIRERRYFSSSEAKKHTVKDLLGRYAKQIEKQNPKRLKDVGVIIEWWQSELGHVVIADLTKSTIVECIDALSLRTVSTKTGERPISPARINRYVSVLSNACTYAVNEWEWLETNPLQKIRKLSEPKGRTRFLDEFERERLLKECKNSKNPYLYIIVVIALSTGARKGEILNLRWKDINFSKNTITLYETKNGEIRSLPMAGHALELLKEHQKIWRIGTDLVFPSSNGKKPAAIRDAWLAAIERAEIDDFRFHDLRHSAASYLAMNGATLAEIAEVLGHKTLQMVKRYAHHSDAHTSSVVASMNEKIFGDG